MDLQYTDDVRMLFVEERKKDASLKRMLSREFQRTSYLNDKFDQHV